MASFALAAVALALGESPASAEEASSIPAEDLRAAEEHFRDAESQKSAGRYEDAAEGYLAAYELLPDPEFLFNAGNMYLLAGSEDLARHYLEQYLELDPDGRGAKDAERALDELGEPKEVVEPEYEAPPPATDPEPMEGTAPAPAPESGPGTLRIAALANGGAGLLALGAGGYFGYRARAASNETARRDTYDPDLVARGERYDIAMFALTGVGAAALITGGVLMYVDSRKNASDAVEERARVTAGPLLSPTTAGLVIEGAF